MTSGTKTVTYPVKDLAQAKTLYSTLLGVDPYMDEPYYVGFNAGGHDVGLDPNGHKQGYDGSDHLLARRRHQQEPRAARSTPARSRSRQCSDVGGGNLTATVKDADGNVFGLFQSA